MKARVKATGEIVEVTRIVDMYVMTHHPHTITFEKDELDFNVEDDLDYWTRLEHQYAGMAMQQLVSLVNVGYDYVHEETAIIALNFAHALIQKLKEKEERK